MKVALPSNAVGSNFFILGSAGTIYISGGTEVRICCNQ